MAIRIMNQDNNHNKDEKALTSIHGAYTLYDTPEPYSEADRVMISHFLNILAEVALSIAARKVKEGTSVE
jgi:hypothetical protein